MSYQLVEDLQKKASPAVTVVQACRVLEVSRSGYYASQAAVKQRLAAPVWLYLAAVLDLHARNIVSWAMSLAMPAALVCAALQMAIVQRNPSP